ncbi:hypothetical protein C2U70_28040 [Bradyrhizobium guangdongense]|uniref:hypothetical protein n=1 Tax=Bradyrhizobium guangdongense TaxID=1325090 RepID=UPI00112B6A18|nr:hypothetical protein [Bradyrhizobium guangdongense]TPQ29712.1 hypothetical protein C2U70_28040 [Bradyrhizobium guangdongense]
MKAAIVLRSEGWLPEKVKQEVQVSIQIFLQFAGFIIIIGLLFVIWAELRRLRMTIEVLLDSTRENSRSLVATILEINARSSDKSNKYELR